MKIKHTIVFEWEDEVDFDTYDPPQTAEKAREYYSEWCMEDEYARLEARAANILPTYKSSYTIEYEDGKRDKYLTE